DVPDQPVGADLSRPAPIHRPSSDIQYQDEKVQKQAIVPTDLLYCRVCFNLADGRRLLFTDPRKFGRIELWPSECEAIAFKGLGPQPLSTAFNAKQLTQ